MKPFDELTDAEAAVLTDEQITYYIDRECAENGVPLLPPTRPEAPSKPIPAHDVTAYRVAGILFTDMAEAAKVRDTINSTLSRGKDGYEWPTYRHYFRTLHADESFVSIEPVTMHSEATSERHKVDLDEHKAASEAHAKDLEAYQLVVSKRSAVADRVYGTLREARQREYRRVALEDLFSRYVTIANGDRRIAWRFLTRAESDAERMLPAIAEEMNMPICLPAEKTSPVAARDIEF